MSELDHAINLLNVQELSPFDRVFRLRRGAPVTIIEWRGCMATDRHVSGTGTVDRIANQRERYTEADSIECLVVRMEDGSVNWQPMQRVKIIDGKVEVWS